MGWNGLIAELTDVPAPLRSGRKEKRREKRLRLHFEVGLADARGPRGAVVLDLSLAGFLMHTQHAISVGDRFTVDLPEAGPVEARVVWKRMTLHGCEFARPVTRAAIAAAMLKAMPGRGPERIV
ncbi:MAG: PilZ domain-containing protein [Novosphingobium sp.]